MASTAGYAVEIVPLYERAKPILDAAARGGLGKAAPSDLSGDVEMSHVSFRYRPDGPLILDDVSLHVRAGEFVAFVGPSGAGKSTIIRLLLGFESPTAGSVHYDHEDLAALDRQALRRQIGVVLQDGKTDAGRYFQQHHRLIAVDPGRRLGGGLPGRHGGRTFTDADGNAHGRSATAAVRCPAANGSG